MTADINTGDFYESSRIETGEAPTPQGRFSAFAKRAAKWIKGPQEDPPPEGYVHFVISMRIPKDKAPTHGQQLIDFRNELQEWTDYILGLKLASPEGDNPTAEGQERGYAKVQDTTVMGLPKVHAGAATAGICIPKEKISYNSHTHFEIKYPVRDDAATLEKLAQCCDVMERYLKHRGMGK